MAFKENPDKKLRVKISGDGANMTRVTSFVILSFSRLDADKVVSSKGNYNNLVSSNCSSTGHNA